MTGPACPLPRLVDERALAEALAVSLTTLRHARLGRGELADLPWIKVGRSCRYDVEQVRAWLDQNRRGTLAKVAPTL